MNFPACTRRWKNGSVAVKCEALGPRLPATSPMPREPFAICVMPARRRSDICTKKTMTSRRRTEIRLTTTESNFFARLFKGRTTTTVTFEGNAEGRDVVQELRTIVPQIEAGEAELRVRVTDLQTGETAEKKKVIWILPVKN